MARQRRYASNAARQKAYRDRVRNGGLLSILAARIIALDSRLEVQFTASEIILIGLGAPAAWRTLESCEAWITYQERRNRLDCEVDQ